MIHAKQVCGTQYLTYRDVRSLIYILSDRRNQRHFKVDPVGDATVIKRDLT